MINTRNPAWPSINIYTDGSCSINPGPGGWAAILEYKNIRREISGGCTDTTNNRMELTAVIMALGELKQNCNVTIYTDSTYVCDPFLKKWIFSWMKMGFDDRKNGDLWTQLLSFFDEHYIDFVWIKGHNGHPENERCDKMAVKETEIILNRQKITGVN